MPKNEDYLTGTVGPDGKPKETSGVEDELRRTFIPPGTGSPVTPAEKIEDAISKIQNTVREQQMATEQNLQNSLSKASTHVADSGTIDTLLSLSQQIASIVSGGDESLANNSSQIDGLISQLGIELGSQQCKVDRQVAMALQQAVSALADAQSTIFQSMAISEMAQQTKAIGNWAKEATPPPQG